jgi:hypothetical protein
MTVCSTLTTTVPNGRCVRVAFDRQNYLFTGSDSGGKRAAAIYSLIGSAKLNELDPEAYLRSVLTRNADHPIKSHRGVAALEHSAGAITRSTTAIRLRSTKSYFEVWSGPQN